ncbi:SRPBCC family protein [Jiangella alkaliphila]|uniref:Polyketide cyclase / dehydrase and lipid transport n=1 Tax=Jiangella alkaliphila TaxID=419479 RepID=A0A1H2LVU2_9ACTN|nr:SRPBCC family protein [Jiangella alkaliphila]SDU84984.1 Polyketide cyclase / dehydrase and lipid transport [Jiangella alkaliphila]
MPGVDAVRPGGETEVGTTLTVHARGKDRTSTIVALEPGRAVTLRSVQGGVTADYRYTCEPAATGTTVSLVADVRTAGLWRLLGPLIRSAIRRADAGQLDAFKRAVETRV